MQEENPNDIINNNQDIAQAQSSDEPYTAATEEASNDSEQDNQIVDESNENNASSQLTQEEDILEKLASIEDENSNQNQTEDYQNNQEAEVTIETVGENEIQDKFEYNSPSDNLSDLVTVRPVKFRQFEDEQPHRTVKKNLDIMQDIPMHVSVELGRTKSTIRDVMELEEGSIVELDKIAGEQVEVYVNQKLVAKGEVIVIEDKFGVRITSTNVGKVEI